MREGGRDDLPRGTVTLLFSDVEGSTELLARLGATAYADELAGHRRLLRAAFAEHGGVEVDTQGDSFFVAFPTARGALDAARAAQDALAGGHIRVRMGIHTGTPELTDEGYVGSDVHRAARIANAAHGGQILVSAVSAALLERTDLQDLGLHRLRGIATPERLYQLGSGTYPPPRTEYQSNLPIAQTPFIGRERETSEVTALLLRDEIRLLTLTGPGGTGKTRLAVAAAAELGGRYPEGVWWVPLAELREATLVIESAARTLGASGDLAARIGDRRMLILFDNFEHVSSAAAEIAVLLAACPGLDILVTSRSRLHVLAEHEYEVPPLGARDAEALFIDRARAIGRELADEPNEAAGIAELCRRLDDLPLAIELAAARVKVMAVAQILARLDSRLSLLTTGARDQPERQRTLRATIEWSWDLLAADEKSIFASLAVFRGGWDLDAAETICDANVDLLQSLVDHSLVRRADQRFVMLQTIRDFAAEILAAAPDADSLHRRHARHYLELAEEAEPHVFSFSKVWLERLAHEHDNMRAALERLEALGETQLALRLAGALQRFWIVRGHLAEGQRRLEGLLSLDDSPTAARAKALNGAALIALNTGDPDAARRLAAEAVELHRGLGDRWGAARSTFVLGYADADQGRFETARERFAASAATFDELADEHNALFVNSNLSWAYRELGENERADDLDRETLRRARLLGNDSIVALALAGLAVAAVGQGRADKALPMIREALQIDRDLGDVRRSVDDLCRLCHVLAGAGQPTLAAQLLGAAENLHVEIGATVSAEISQLNDRTVAAIKDQIGQAALDQAQSETRVMSFDEAYRLALPAGDQVSGDGPGGSVSSASSASGSGGK